ncbi:TPR-like protein [Ophiobolus disseminans]|uniref:TPR-like protein n=1 Tax=Ophiobolus disseminans TaxID=1469910 RepID=A0A6A6ZDE5_9PLEO|nr:TPR-like protein [Ophiobolus disseminans]
MLERASTCFETGRRQLLRAPTRCLPSRHMLYSAFWHHGASDLSLPVWWADSSILDGGSGDVDDQAARTTFTPSRAHDGPLLTFLYPEKTLALLRQLTAPRQDFSESRRRQVHRPPVRHFATAQWQPPHDESGVDPTVLEQTKEELASMLQDARPFQVLSRFLKNLEPGKQELAWQLYASIPARHLELNKGASLKAKLLEYITLDDEHTVPSRVIQLFDELPLEKRRPSSYRAAIVAYISLRMVGPAIQLLEHVRIDRHFDSLYLGTDVILRRTILDEQWDLSLRVFRLFVQQRPVIGNVEIRTAIRSGMPLPQIWSGVTTLPGLRDHLQSFLAHVREFKHELRSSVESTEALSLFSMSFVPHVIDQVTQDRDLDEKDMATYVQRVFRDLRKLGLSAPVCYDHAIRTLLELPQHRAVHEVPTLCMNLYERYRTQYLESQDMPQSKPSLNVLRNLIVYHGDHNDLTQAQRLIKDLHTFYPDKPMSHGLLKYLIHMYADYGDVVRVQKYFHEFTAHYRRKLDLKVVSSLPFAYARRADVAGAIAQFNRIHTDFHLVPDLACWNILLLSYVRADDLDGALECFNSCLDNGIEPDEYSFGTLLDLCADRGDVEAFEALFSRAKQKGIQLTHNVRARSGYVQAFLNAGDPDGAESIAQGMLRSWQSGMLRGHALTHTWNLLIQHHALDNDIASARQRYKEMVDNRIPLDSWTYGSLMRALVAAKQSNAAYKMLRKTMPQSHLPVHAFHYAIVMTGFLREGGDQLNLAMAAYARMVEQEVPQTESSREASIRTLGALELKKLKEEGAKGRRQKLKLVEEAVEKMLVEAVQGQVAHRQPRHSRLLDSRNYGSAVQAYYGLLISLYSQVGAYKLCHKLFRKAEKAAPDVDNYTVPMTLITGTMEAHLKFGQHAEVAKCWELARTAANKLSKTFQQAVQPEPVTPESDSILDPSVRDLYEQSRISFNRRNILYKAARLYIRSLSDPANPNPDALQEAQRTMIDLIVNGYTLDVFTWNEFVTTLAQRGRLVDAFSICEKYLMPNFPGWRNLYPNYIRKDRTGYQWMELRHYEIKKSSLMPRYKTLIALAAEFRQVKSDERNGLGYDESAEAWQREILEGLAPMTLRAIETMPRTSDKLQMEYFHNQQ